MQALSCWDEFAFPSVVVAILPDLPELHLEIRRREEEHGAIMETWGLKAIGIGDSRQFMLLPRPFPPSLPALCFCAARSCILLLGGS